MSSQKIITHRTPADGNIFADLGFAPDEAARLLANADQAIDEKRALKQMLMVEIAGWIDVQNLKQAQAAEILGVARPRVSDVVNQKTPQFHGRLFGGHGFAHGQARSAVCPIGRTQFS